ncbi:DUF2931 domain-containing protein [Thalassotalea euphylliae]|nr:DUF2931 domain-containing protein [Thalassotalea euphylliae]
MMIRLMISLLMVLPLIACTANQPIKYMVIGSSTVKGNELMVRPLVFDDSWRKPVGNLGCCWQEAGALSGAWGKYFPKKVAVQWHDESQSRLYSTEVKIDHVRGEKIARNLPTYTIVSLDEIKKNVKPYLIVGFGEQGEVTVWISNAPSEMNISGRILVALGSGQATWEHFDPY